ncbi:hypothetical protein [Geothrix sp. 21YS21S-2]|uniref:hypothetical protein n=1 Tax=Geothrix sp. 21YS21S-2 TaxID=3068893 RepID=UPI0027B9CA5C|nr:hypothetical protein [Geothrix sp. 21YS21S-2]
MPTCVVGEHHAGLPIEQDLPIVLDSREHAFLGNTLGREASRSFDGLEAFAV